MNPPPGEDDKDVEEPPPLSEEDLDEIVTGTRNRIGEREVDERELKEAIRHLAPGEYEDILESGDVDDYHRILDGLTEEQNRVVERVKEEYYPPSVRYLEILADLIRDVSVLTLILIIVLIMVIAVVIFMINFPDQFQRIVEWLIDQLTSS